MTGRLVIKPLPLVELLTSEMGDALEAMEAGDYDAAHAVLEERCRPGDALLQAPRTVTLHAAQAAREILRNAPHGILRAGDDYAVSHAAAAVAAVMSRPLAEIQTDKLAVAVGLANDCGITLEWQDEP